MTKKILDLLLSQILKIISLLVPKNDNLVVFSSGHGYRYQWNPRAFFEYCGLQNDTFQYIWLTKSRSLTHSLEEKWIPVVYAYSMHWFRTILRAKIIILENIDQLLNHCLVPSNVLIQTFHWIPLKSIAHTNYFEKIFARVFELWLLRKNYYVLSSSSYVTSTIDGDIKFFADNFLEFWYPRNDALFDEHDPTLWDIDVSTYSKIYGYFPTWRDTGMDVDFLSFSFLRELNEHLAKNDILFLIKLHPRSPYTGSGEYSHIRNITKANIDTADILPHLDLLITDYSSIFLDFILLDKPFILYCFDMQEYMEHRNLNYDYYIQMVWPFAHTEDELINLIKSVDIWQQESTHLEKYKALKDMIYEHQDDRSSERLYGYLHDFIIN